MIQSILTHRLARKHHLDDPKTTALRRRIIQEKPLLRQAYKDWYHLISSSIEPSSHRILEIGSGAGFLNETIPHLITSDILPLPWTKLVMNGLHLPFSQNALDALIMVNVLHHIPDPTTFFYEAARCIKPLGKIIMIEPWATTLSRFIYTHFHYEPFDPDIDHWTLESIGPLSTANDAMPWILFERDLESFQKSFPMWQIAKIKPSISLPYLLSGGVSMPSLMPGWTYRFWRCFEVLLEPLAPHLAMFAQIELIKR
jgi:SAM-dependent methyltransferase